MWITAVIVGLMAALDILPSPPDPPSRHAYRRLELGFEGFGCTV